METSSNVNFQIIEFQPQYRDQVIDVIGKVLRQLKVILQSDEPLTDEDLYKIPEVYSGKGKFWVAIYDGKVIGTVAIKDMGQQVAKLNRMFVLFDYHGKGVGQGLLNEALAFAKDQGYKEIILNTHKLMKRAHHFYEKNGFRMVGKKSDKYHYRLDL